MERQSIYLLLVCITCMVRVQSFPFDFSDRECKDMFPQRFGTDAVIDDHHPPFRIEPKDTIFADVPVTVVISATGNHHMIKGLLLQARAADGSCDSTPLGYYYNITNNGHLMSVTCGSTANTVANAKWGGSGKKEVEIAWYPPHKHSSEKRNVYFVATVVSGQNLFWTGVTSHAVRSIHGPPIDNLDHTGVYSKCNFRKKYYTTGTTSGFKNSAVNLASTYEVFLILCLLSLLW